MPLSQDEKLNLLETLEDRFNVNQHRHEKVDWLDVKTILEGSEEKLVTLSKMEASGGEPDVVTLNGSKEILFIDCSKESPKGRRSVCYDREALESRKKHKPENSAVDLANEIGIQILDEEQYSYLQQIEAFDLKSSSWIQTPKRIRDLGGALFCDRRYDTVFVYHNGAESYYSARGFRGILHI
ncbi:DUF4256 domain-containing protein [Halalkalibacillus halophilus]|uniref:DUF4256 domain-containing protein n=1 Tax=Halalkalibacillus halophilus TaxID=392827 RepID=UPI0004191265|nr:DUF4256 domain-containing protein [Halalkalibacillus halophilus]